MQDWHKISVVTPSYNHASFLEKTIQSVLNQNYSNLEYIIIDGGSTDGSVELIKKYERYLHFWVSEPDNGQAAAINKGWRIASGDLITWLNSDDIYLPHAFEVASTSFRQNPQFAMIYGDWIDINAEGQLIETRSSPDFDFNLLARGKFGPRSYKANYISQPATFLQRFVLDTVGLLDETLDLCMDYDYWLRIGKCCEIKHLPIPLAGFRIHNKAKTQGGKETNARLWRELRLISKRHGYSSFPPYYLSYLLNRLLRIPISRLPHR